MMGYYSTVFFACLHDQHELILAATELEPDVTYGKETSEDEEYFCCEWNGVKWGYTSDTTDFEGLLQMMSGQQLDGSTRTFGYIRMGEEDDDVEYIGDPWAFGINYVRYLEWG
tara:strand:- start:2038 stop:2376 length:339 start_codon:yes stop_codon:yes gene_type:complete